jgi:hypothetical protein
MKGYKESKTEACLRLKYKKSKCEVGRRNGRWKKEREKEICLKNEKNIKKHKRNRSKIKEKIQEKIEKNKLQ